MKKLAIVLMAMSVLVVADYLEVKTGEGKAYVSISTKPKLYVCYDKRIKFITDDTVYLRYDGCRLYRNSCRYNGKAHFGKYPNQASAKRALYRCKTANPKFID